MELNSDYEEEFNTIFKNIVGDELEENSTDPKSLEVEDNKPVDCSRNNSIYDIPADKVERAPRIRKKRFSAKGSNTPVHASALAPVSTVIPITANEHELNTLMTDLKLLEPCFTSMGVKVTIDSVSQVPPEGDKIGGGVSPEASTFRRAGKKASKKVNLDSKLKLSTPDNKGFSRTKSLAVPGNPQPQKSGRQSENTPCTAIGTGPENEPLKQELKDQKSLEGEENKIVTFEEARSSAIAKKKWLLAIILSLDEKLSLIYRDVWTKDYIEKEVKKCFIFWEVDATTLDGLNHCIKYNVSLWPHVSIIDPRDGECMCSLNTIDSSTISLKLSAFLRVHNYMDKPLFKRELLTKEEMEKRAIYRLLKLLIERKERLLNIRE